MYIIPLLLLLLCLLANSGSRNYR